MTKCSSRANFVPFVVKHVQQRSAWRFKLKIVTRRACCMLGATQRWYHALPPNNASLIAECTVYDCCSVYDPHATTLVEHTTILTQNHCTNNMTCSRKPDKRHTGLDTKTYLSTPDVRFLLLLIKTLCRDHGLSDHENAAYSSNRVFSMASFGVCRFFTLSLHRPYTLRDVMHRPGSHNRRSFLSTLLFIDSR